MAIWGNSYLGQNTVTVSPAMVADDGLSEDSTFTYIYADADSFTFQLDIEPGSTDGTFTPTLS